MAQLVDGVWADDPPRTSAAFERAQSKVRGWIRADGSTAFLAETGRYHLWLAWNCTWSQRTMIVRNLLGLQDAIGHTMAHWHRNDDGWWYREGLDSLQPEWPMAWESWDHEQGFQRAEPVDGLPLWRVYVASDAAFSGRVTVPALWDRQQEKLVSNESSEILRMLEEELGPAVGNDVDLLPADLRGDIDAVNRWVYDDINNGVYKVGFAGSQAVYEAALHGLFAALDRVEARLGQHRYLCGDRLTEADVRLFPTLIRFDAVYFGHFKCNVRRIADYPHMSGYLRDLYQTPGVAETCWVEGYKLGYMGRSERLNPSRIIGVGPDLALDAPHGRARYGLRRFERRVG